jgi:hypothetical protein
MKTTTFTTLGIAALLVAGAFSNGCSSASTGTTGNGGSGGSAGGSTGNGGTAGTGSGGATDAGDLAMCDPALKDKDPCTAGVPDCKKTCGISMSGATKPCTCNTTTGLWSCSVGTCVYPSTFDKTCYMRPAAGTTPQACPALTQSGTTPCTPTTPCAASVCLGYYDSTGNPKADGLCSCTGMKAPDGGVADGGDPDGGATISVYQCASATEFPM